MENLMLHWDSMVIPIVILIPNLIWLLFPPTNAPAPDDIKEPVILIILEYFGRIGVTVIPFSYPVVMDNAVSHYYLISMITLLVVYYVGWFRFFFEGRNYTHLFLPLRWIPIPIPMAVCPVLYFILSAGLLKSIPMFIAALVLAFGHLAISYKEYQRIIHRV
jgi:hypothetical protein